MLAIKNFTVYLVLLTGQSLPSNGFTWCSHIHIVRFATELIFPNEQQRMYPRKI